MKARVRIRGSQEGLLLLLEGAVDFDLIEQEIKSRLETGAFARGSVLELAEHAIDERDWKRLEALLKTSGVILRARREKEDKTPKKAPAQKSSQIQAPTPSPSTDVPLLVVERTVRSGQEVQTQGSVLVLGNVNPGAHIIAGGNIDIRGTCQGIVHAGAYGDQTAFILADRLMPTQIRIAEMIAQAPDTIEAPNKAEKAVIRDGQIVIESLER